MLPIPEHKVPPAIRLPVVRIPRGRRGPQLGVIWEPRGRTFWTSFLTLLYGPAPPKGRAASPFFGQSWLKSKLRARALFYSVILHIGLFNLNIPYGDWLGSKPRPKGEFPRIEVTWYAPPRDLPTLTPPKLDAGKRAKPGPPGDPAKPLPRRGADAYHPRQTIFSAPLRPTHPRQTLIQPEAPPDAPKILPALPNIVQWHDVDQPAKPKLRLSPTELARMRRREATRKAADVAAPTIPNEPRQSAAINIAPSAVEIPRPLLSVATSAKAKIGKRDTSGDVGPAPDLAPNANSGDDNSRRLIALSATPAEPAPVVQVPPGNLFARVSISPEGPQPGVPGGATNGTHGSNGGAGGGPESPGGLAGGGGTQPGTGAGGDGGVGPPGISISGGDPSRASNASGLGGSGIGINRPRNVMPGRPMASPAKPTPEPSRTRPSPAFERIRPGAPPEEILGPKRVYTMNVNMPNLASATGSWVLQFAELTEDSEKHRNLPPGTHGDAATDLLGPVPLRKVDPKYPPALASAHVEGEVVLYAIIRRDGSVDSIQLVKGLEPRLDQNAMDALARWKFRPAERKGAPIELEAVVRIPFRAIAPL